MNNKDIVNEMDKKDNMINRDVMNNNDNKDKRHNTDKSKFSTYV